MSLKNLFNVIRLLILFKNFLTKTCFVHDLNFFNKTLTSFQNLKELKMK